MTDKLKQIVKEELIKLPKESQEVINTFDWESISKEIGEKYLLDENGIDKLQAEIFLVMSGITEESSLSLNIENNVEISKYEAKNIIEEINQKIFTPMLEKRESLIKRRAILIKPNWKQTVNFIVSGGNYSAFVEETENKKDEKVAYREVI